MPLLDAIATTRQSRGILAASERALLRVARTHGEGPLRVSRAQGVEDDGPQVPSLPAVALARSGERESA